MGLVELDQAVGTARSALLDSSVLLAFFNAHERVHPLAKHLLSRIEHKQDPLQGYYSAISVMELLVRPMAVGSQVADTLLTSLMQFPNLRLVQVDAVVARQAADVRSRAKISPADALVVASGLVTGCEVIISNDDQWQKRLDAHFPQARFIYLDAYR